MTVTTLRGYANSEVLIPKQNAEAIARRFGPSGERFLRELPQRLAAIAARWNLVLGESLPVGIGGYLVAVRTASGDDAVLKLSPTGAAEQDKLNELEAYALRRWDGEGAVKLFDADLAAGALLIERCVPGHSIESVPEEQLVTDACALARLLHRAPDAADEALLPNATVDVAEQQARLDEAMGAMGHPLSPHAERVIQRMHEEVLGDGPRVVCHGDLNPGNVLAAERMAWLAVDPWPVLAPAAYDAASLVWSKRPWLLAAPDPAAILDRRIALAADAIGAGEYDVRAWDARPPGRAPDRPLRLGWLRRGAVHHDRRVAL
jgi:streptomycin 6-kinase